MKPLLSLLLIAVVACATPQARIKSHEAAFNTYPPAIQESIRAGKVEIGYTREQAEMALGRPERKYERRTAAVTQDVWAYGTVASGPSLGLGFGLGGSGGAYGGSLGIASEAGHEDRLRIVFQGDGVVSIEKLQH